MDPISHRIDRMQMNRGKVRAAYGCLLKNRLLEQGLHVIGARPGIGVLSGSHTMTGTDADDGY